MTEHQVIAFLCGCIGVMGFVLMGLDHMNDRLREENKRLRERLKEKGDVECAAAELHDKG